MLLEQWRKNNQMSYMELSKFLEIKPSTTQNICKGVGCITLRNAYTIIQKTGGVVTYADLLEVLEDC